MGMNKRLSSLLGQCINPEEQNTTYAFYHNASKTMCNKDDRPTLGLLVIRSQPSKELKTQTTLVNRLSKLRSDTKF